MTKPHVTLATYDADYTLIRYVCKRNSDLTEGRGGMVAFAYATTEEEALRLVYRQGVQAVGDGEIYVEEVDRNHPDPSKIVRQRMVYGYHQDPLTKKWRHGWTDYRDVPQHDPEWAEYVRLCQKFDAATGVAPWLAARPS